MSAVERIMRVLAVVTASFTIPFVITLAIARHLHSDPDTVITLGFVMFVAMALASSVPVLYAADRVRGLSNIEALRRAARLSVPSVVFVGGLLTLLWIVPVWTRFMIVAAIVAVVVLYPEEEPDGIAFFDHAAAYEEQRMGG